MEGFYTELPNDFIDRGIPALSPNAIKLYIVMMRATNFKRDNSYSCWLSYDSLMKKMGVKYRDAVSNAIQELVIEGWIVHIEFRNMDSNLYILSDKPIPNQDLMVRMMNRRTNKSQVAKERHKSTLKDDAGKFQIEIVEEETDGKL